MTAKFLGKIVVALVFLLFVQGCMGRPVRFNEANNDIKKDNVDFSRGRKIEASASGLQLLLLIPIGINDRHDRAFGILRGQAGDSYITDIKVEESWTYAFVGTVYTTRIQAMAYQYKK